MKTLTGKTIVCNGILPYHTVEVVKNMLQDAEGIPPDQQRLVYEGKQLGDAETMHNVPGGAIIHMVLRMRGGMYDETSGRIDYEEVSDQTVTVVLENTLGDELARINTVSVGSSGDELAAMLRLLTGAAGGSKRKRA